MKQHVVDGNIFADLGLDNPNELSLKASLAIEIALAMKNRGLTQSAMAKLIGATQAEISELKNGRLERFTIERLFRYMIAINRDIQVNIIRRNDDKKGSIKVLRCA